MMSSRNWIWFATCANSLFFAPNIAFFSEIRNFLKSISVMQSSSNLQLHLQTALPKVLPSFLLRCTLVKTRSRSWAPNNCAANSISIKLLFVSTSYFKSLNFLFVSLFNTLTILNRLMKRCCRDCYAPNRWRCRNRLSRRAETLLFKYYAQNDFDSNCFTR